MGNAVSNTGYVSLNDKEKTDRIGSFYKKGKSKRTYVGIVRENDIDIKKNFGSKEDAMKWIFFIRNEINKGNKDLVLSMKNSYT